MTDIATTTGTKPSRKLLREWDWDVSVGIYDNCTYRVRLYADRAVLQIPGVKWSGNTGTYHLYRDRVDAPNMLPKLLEISAQEMEDGEDYTDRVADQIAEWAQCGWILRG